MKRFNLYISALLLAAASFTGCQSPKDIVYFQDLNAGETLAIANPKEIKILPSDKLSIIVKSKDPMLADLFNLPVVAHRVGYTGERGIGQSQEISIYTVDNEGMIDFPVLGKIKVEGLNRRQVADKIKHELIERHLVNDPTVTVEFDNMFVSILGEVIKPGRYVIDRDRVTILDLLGMAGDLSIYGRRDNVAVIRTFPDGKTQTYRVNLTNVNDVYASPAFNLQQNDVVYVEPNETRQRESTVNGNNLRSTSFWISVASLLTSVGVLIVNIAK